MANFSFDSIAYEAIKRSKLENQGAVDALRIAAEYLRRREVLPDNLAEWLADAIEASMGKPEPENGRYLLLELGLTAANRRPAADWIDVSTHWDALISDGMSKTQARAATAAAFDIDETTVKRYVTQYRNIPDVDC